MIVAIQLELDACQLPECRATAAQVAQVIAASSLVFVVGDIFDVFVYTVVIELV